MRPAVTALEGFRMLAAFVVFAVLLSGHTRAQQVVTYAFSGVMEGNSIFGEGTPFTGSFTYSCPQEPSTNGTYRLQSYDLTIQGQSRPISGITSGSGFIVFPGSTVSLPGTTWSGANVTSGVPPITVTDGSPDIFSVFIPRAYTMEFSQGKLLIYGPNITLSDSTGTIFDDVNLPNISVLQDRFTSGSIGISYEVQGVSSAAQTGRITSLAPVQPLVNIETVTVGDAGNAADPLTGFGAVTNKFNIGKFEITISQYTTFLNSAAQSDPYGLYDGQMTSMPRIAGISRSGNSGSYAYQVIGPSGLTPVGAFSPGGRPITFVSWFDAARFCNWLHNGATSGASTETGAYMLNGATSGVFTKTPNAKWWIPSLDEWYKAAYYKGGSTNSGYWLYPTQRDTPPGHLIGSAPNNANILMAVGSAENSLSYVHAVTQLAGFSQTQNYLTEVGAFSGSPSYYGTFDQAGNVREWNDAIINNHSRGLRGGDWTWTKDFAVATFGDGRSPFLGEHDAGFRVATAASVTTNIVLTVEKTTNLSGQWQFDREINAGSMTSANASYRLNVAVVPGSTTNVVLSVETTGSQTTQWQFDRDINVGPMTNTNEFYRLKIGTVVE